MDIDSLRNALEEQLKRHSHPDAPDGFRDRFEQAVEHHAAETDADDKAQLEAQLKRIRDEAEAAANADCGDGGDGGDGGDAPRPRQVPVGEPAPREPDPLGPVSAGRSRTRLGLILGAVAAAAATAFYFYSGS